MISVSPAHDPSHPLLNCLPERHRDHVVEVREGGGVVGEHPVLAQEGVEGVARVGDRMV